jgi:hypothetical protein
MNRRYLDRERRNSSQFHSLWSNLPVDIADDSDVWAFRRHQAESRLQRKWNCRLS